MASAARTGSENDGKKTQLGRYGFFKITNDWLHVLSRSEDGKGLSQAELIKKAMDDIQSGEIDEAEIEKRKSKMRTTGPQQEEVAEEIPEPEKEKKEKKEKKGKSKK